MSIFTKIKDAIFGKDEPARRPSPLPSPTAQAPVGVESTTPSPAPTHAPVIDIENNLDSMPGADRLNWRTSIVDLMKLIGVDSDYESRKALAIELGRPNYSGSTEDNVWLHRRVMGELDAHGGRVPPEFLD